MKFSPPKSEHVITVLQGVAVGLDRVIDLLPAEWATKVRSARKAVFGGASALLSVLAALSVVPLPDGSSPWVALALAACTGIVTYWVPNEDG